MWNQIKNWGLSQVREWVYPAVISPIEPIDIIRGDGLSEHDVLAQVDLLRDDSIIDAQLAKDLGIYHPETVNERKEYTDEYGKKHLSDVVSVSFTIQGVEKISRWIVSDRREQKHLICLGKADVAGLYIFIQSTRE